jgi:hypothetical protein
VKEWKKIVLVSIATFMAGFFNVFVLMQLWNWFVPPVLHFGEVNYFQMYGLNLLFGAIIARDTAENPVKTAKWNKLMLMVNACVPDFTRQAMVEELKEEDEKLWGELGGWVFGAVFAYVFALGFGFILHIFAT